MSGQTISTSETRIEAFRLQSSSYGVTIPLVYGLRRITGNMLWYGGFKAIPHTTSQGGKGGVKVQNTTFTYSASVMMALCHGRITGIPKIWRGKKLHQGGVTPAQVLTTSQNYTPPGSGAMTVTLTQAATYVAIVSITAPWGSTEAWNRTLQKGSDYTCISGVVTILNDAFRGLLLTIRYQYTSGTIVTTALSQLGLTFIPGELGQSPWSGLSSYGSMSIGYSGLAIVAGQDYDLGTGAQVENHGFEVVAPMAYHLGSSVPDVDPSLVLRDILSNAYAGANFPGAYLDDWSNWSDYCVASSLLVSPALTEQVRAADLVERAGELTNTRPVFVGGRLKMVPRADTAVTGNGRTYTPSVTPVYNLDDECFCPRGDSAPLTVAAKSPADRYNHVRVQYAARSLDYNASIAEAKDQAENDAFGLRSSDVIDARSWICSDAAARQVAQLKLQRSLFVANEYSFSLPWHFALLEPSDIVTLTDAGLQMSAVGACITVIEENDDGDLEMVAEDFPAGTGGAAAYPVQVPAGFLHDYNASPGNADTPVIFEAPPEWSVTGLALLIAVKGGGANWGGAQVWVSQDGTNYRMAGTVYGRARMGTLSANALAGATSISVQGLGSEQLISGSAADAAALNTLCWVGGTNREYFAYQTATLTGAGAYTLGGIVHSAFRTRSLTHATGDAFVRVDERVIQSEDLAQSMVGSTVYVKLCSFNIFGAALQSLADVSATTYQVKYVAPVDNRNLLNPSTWVYGTTGDQPGFNARSDGPITENTIGFDTAPDGVLRLVWNCLSSDAVGGVGVTHDGGYDTDAVKIDHTKLYRFSVWFKPVANLATGILYLGPKQNTVADVDTGSANSNPYFAFRGRSTFTAGRWYLFVGYVLPSSYGTTQLNSGGIYDGVTGRKIFDGTDFKWLAGQEDTGVRAFSYSGEVGAETNIWGPRIDLCDGREPKLNELLNVAGSVQIGVGAAAEVFRASGGPFSGASGNTHVNEATTGVIDVDAELTIVVEGEFSAVGNSGAIIYTRFAPIWSINGGGWIVGDLTHVRLIGAGSEIRLPLSASEGFSVSAGSTVSAGIYFVDHITAQNPGTLSRAKTRVELIKR